MLQSLLRLAQDPQTERGQLESALWVVGRQVLQRYAPDVDLWELSRLNPVPGPDSDWQSGASPPPQDTLARWVQARRAQLPPNQVPWQALQAYPPLALFVRLCEALALTRLRASLKEPCLKADGRINISNWPERGLALAALQRACQVWGLCSGENLSWPVHPWQAEWNQRFDSQGGSALRHMAQQQASSAGFWLWQWEEVKSTISVGQRLKFWTRSQAKGREEWLRKAHKHELEQLNQSFLQLWKVAAQVSWSFPIMALRQTFYFVHQETARIHDSDGNVMHREVAQEQLDELRAQLDVCLPWVGSIPDLLARLRNRQLDHPELAQVHQQLSQRDELAGLDFLAELADLQEQTRVQRRRVDASIGFWDRINLFKKTPEKEARSQLNLMHKSVTSELEQVSERVWETFTQLRPEILLHLRLLPMQQTLSDISASTTTSHNSDGTTSHDSQLHGLKSAQSAQRDWGKTFHAVYGPLGSPGEWLGFP